MKSYVVLGFLFLGLLANGQVTTLVAGQVAPAISLKNIDGKQVSLTDFPAAKGFIIVFTCNTCPYAKAYEQRIIALDKKFAAAGYPVIAINPNDATLSPGDSFEKMKERAKAKGYSFPYLYDAGQSVTNQYGARSTPHVFLISKTGTGNIIEYTGAIDNDAENSNPDKIQYLQQAIEALQADKKPTLTMTRAIGCGVKRKSAG